MSTANRSPGAITISSWHRAAPGESFEAFPGANGRAIKSSASDSPPALLHSGITSHRRAVSPRVITVTSSFSFEIRDSPVHWLSDRKQMNLVSTRTCDPPLQATVPSGGRAIGSSPFPPPTLSAAKYLAG